ncbi:hypothetical protein VB779_20490 [Haloarculaceae archaeon H-GB11]|nr:hypothetical protein [Haloarculaceae archaeon H-GB11]
MAEDHRLGTFGEDFANGFLVGCLGVDGEFGLEAAVAVDRLPDVPTKRMQPTVTTESRFVLSAPELYQ